MPKINTRANYSNIMRGLHKHERGAFRMYCKSQERTILQQLRFYIRNFSNLNQETEE